MKVFDGEVWDLQKFQDSDGGGGVGRSKISEVKIKYTRLRQTDAHEFA
jgi:hypothetical protein